MNKATVRNVIPADEGFLTSPWHQYRIDLDLVPKMQYLDAVVYMRYYATSENLEWLRLYLHRHLDVQSVEGELVTDWWFDQREVAPIQHLNAGRVLHVRLGRLLRSGEDTGILFRYSGRLVEAASGEHFILGQHLPWVPFNDAYGPYSFGLSASCEGGCHLSSFGEGDWSNDVWRFNWPYPTQEIVLVAVGAK